MHYFGAAPVSADYFGRFCLRMKQLMGKDGTDLPCVAMMSQGTAGDLHWMDYSQPAANITLETYSNEVAEVAFRAYQQIEYRDWVPLAMAEQKLTLGRRVPDEKRLAWRSKSSPKCRDARWPRTNARCMRSSKSIFTTSRSENSCCKRCVSEIWVSRQCLPKSLALQA